MAKLFLAYQVTLYPSTKRNDAKQVIVTLMNIQHCLRSFRIIELQLNEPFNPLSCTEISVQILKSYKYQELMTR